MKTQGIKELQNKRTASNKMDIFPKMKPKTQSMEERLFEILEESCGLFKDRDGKWRESGEGYNTDFEPKMKRLLDLISQARKEDKKKLKKNIGQLRQWLNERGSRDLITNEELEVWLFEKRSNK